VERHALLCGYSVERRVHDYGIDLTIATYDGQGKVEPGAVLAQLKATDHLKRVAGGQMVACRIERADLRAWLREPWPVILVVYDAVTDMAFWLYVQEHFQQKPRFNPDRGSASVTIRIPRANVVNATAMRHFARCRDRLPGPYWYFEHSPWGTILAYRAYQPGENLSWHYLVATHRQLDERGLLEADEFEALLHQTPV
jgi:hypothetical protein